MSTDSPHLQNDTLENAVFLEKCWAALRDDTVVGTISMRVPNDVDFDSFREKAVDTLNMLGQVRAGELYRKAGERFFLPRPHKHQNRSKRAAKVERKLLPFAQPPASADDSIPLRASEQKR